LISKKAAIQLSMTTIIVIIIGVVLLGLGLTWVKSTFDRIGGLTDSSFTTADKVIQEDMAPDDSFYIAGFSIDAKKGKFSEIYAGVQFFSENEADTGEFTLVVTDDSGGTLDWTTTKVIAKAGERKGLPFGVTVPSNAIEDTYSVTVTARLDGQFYESEAFLLNVV
jgi:hypothetical protein